MKKTISACLALAAVALVGVLSVSPASAGAAEFAASCAEVEECYFLGEQSAENTFTVNGGTLKCAVTKFEGAATAATGATTGKTVGSGQVDTATVKVKVHPTYESCSAFGQKVTITTTGCNYVISATSLTAGTASIECEAGKSIVLKGNTTGCTVTIAAQTPFNNAVDFAIEGTPKDIKLTETIGTEPVEKGKNTGVTYTSSGGVCGESGNNGAYRGTVTVKAFKEAAHKNQLPCTWVEIVKPGTVDEIK